MIYIFLSFYALFWRPARFGKHSVKVWDSSRVGEGSRPDLKGPTWDMSVQ